MTFIFPRRLTTIALSLLLCACMHNPAYREGRDLAAEGQDEQALVKYRAATQEVPGNAEYRAAYLRMRDRLISRWIDRARSARQNRQDEDAGRLYQRVIDEDPANAKARNGLSDLARDVRHRELVVEAEAAWKRQDAEAAMSRLRRILSENPSHVQAAELKQKIETQTPVPSSPPRLAAAMSKTITIEFKEAPLRQVFEVFSRTSGLNFVFDKDVRGEQRATIFLRNTTIRDAINLALLTNQLEQRVLDSNSILIFPNTAAKLKDYLELTVKTFFLANVDAKTAAANLKTIVRTKDIVVDEKQNLITIRDTPDAIRMAEKLLALYDLPEPEVMLEVEILEISRAHLMNLGIQWPDQATLTPLAGPSGTLTLADLKNHTSSSIGVAITPLTLNAKKTDGEANVLANPRIRARNRESAKVLIGDRVPNITTTSTSTGFVSENIQYVDVGLKLEVQPTVFADNEVAIKISLEVSNIVDKIQTKSGALAYQIGTRNVSTLLRLKDGENQVLAGLIRDEDRSSGNRIPGLGDIPIFGRLFGSQRDETTKTEIILSITPRLVREIRRPNLAAAEFDSGSESMMRVRPEGENLVTSSPATSSPATSLPAIPTGAQPTGAASQLPTAIVTGATDTTATAESPRASSIALTGPAQVKRGSEFSLQLAAHPGETITSVPVALSYDPKVLEVTGVSEGEFLKQGQGNTSFSNRVDRANGHLFATITRTNSGGATAPGNILSVKFRALSVAKETRVLVTAISPIGVGGKVVGSPLPDARIIEVTP